ncbi:MAG: DUF4783 domain-containing protein [Ignavibacteriae bacterium]|nr:DUF4783 domain-containing protein [Ignavibacteriota bacterium]
MKLLTALGLALLVLSTMCTTAQEKRDSGRQRDKQSEEKGRRKEPSRDDARQAREPVRRVSPPATSDPVVPPPTDVQIRQRQNLIDQKRSGRQVTGDYRGIFEGVQQGLSSGNIGVFAEHFASQVFVNLRDGESGYYSANQAYYVLENYFRSRRVMSFDFTTIGESESNPYATGSAGLSFKGTREIAQVYVSLSRAGDRWVITQINIY